nr:hypothetical protein [Clostridia bacterium]
MKYISRLTALLLAMMLLAGCAAAEMSLEGLTMNELDWLYLAASDAEDLRVTDVLGATSPLTSEDAAAWQNLGCTLQWYALDTDGSRQLLPGETGTSLEITYTLAEQRFVCVATDATDVEHPSPVYIAQALTDDMEAYLTVLYTEFYYLYEIPSYDDEDYSIDSYAAAAWQWMQTWNVTLADGSNLAENVLNAWWAEKTSESFENRWLCSCVITNAAASDFCILSSGADHVGTCGWHTAKVVLTDEETGIMVKGDIPADVTLSVTDAAGPMPEIDVRHFNALRNYPLITSYNITLLNADGSEYAVPAGSTVKVIIPKAWLSDMEYPVVDIYHVKDSGEVVYLTSRLGEVVLLDDGSANFETDGFSDFWISSGSQYTNYFNNGESHVFYMAPGTEAQVGSYKWLFDQNAPNAAVWAESTNVDAANVFVKDGMIYVAVDADVSPDDDTPIATVKIYWSGWDWTNSATVTVYVISEQEKEEINHKDKLNNQGYPVQLTIRSDGVIPNEPCVWDGTSYIYFQAQEDGNYKVCGSSDLFASTAENVIKETIFDHELFYFVSRDGNAVIGMVDPTGIAIKQVLKNIDWDAMLLAAANAGTITGSNGEKLGADNVANYHIVPYVVKCQETDGKGWHIDCSVVYNGAVHLNYDLNIPAGMTITTQGVNPPNNETGIEPEEFVVATIEGMLQGETEGNKYEYIMISTEYTFKFKEWNTSPDGSGMTYLPEETIKISEDTTLYAIWDITPELNSGSLRVCKVVQGSDTSNDELFTFDIVIPHADADGYKYILYGADKVAVKDENGTGMMKDGDTFSLRNGQYVVITGLPISKDGDVVTVRETNSGDYVPLWSGGQTNGNAVVVAIMDGRMSEVVCTNSKEVVTGELTVIKSGLKDAKESAIVEVKVGGDTYHLVLNAANKYTATISGIKVDAQYTVAELDRWTWQYTGGGTASGTLTKEQPTATVTIKNTFGTDKWMHDESHVTNDFNTGTKNESYNK